jgi:RimJ/RimL family protein N-acetyltransferase
MKDDSSKLHKYDVFISGETIDLCVPSDDEWTLSQWFRWFNNDKITTHLAQGIYPNTLNLQRKYCNTLEVDNSRIALLIKPKNYDGFIGIASLSSINLAQRQCDFAMVIGERIDAKGSLFYGLEAKALLTQHAMEKVGVERVNSSQSIDLIRWQNWQILFGYQVEGLLRKKFRKGNKTYDVIVSSCLLEDYEKLVNVRDGNLWPGKSKMFQLLKELPDQTPITEIISWLPNKQKLHWQKIFTKEFK